MGSGRARWGRSWSPACAGSASHHPRAAGRVQPVAPDEPRGGHRLRRLARSGARVAEVLGLLAEDWLGALQWSSATTSATRPSKGLRARHAAGGAGSWRGRPPVLPPRRRELALLGQPHVPGAQAGPAAAISAASQQMGPGHDPGAYFNERDIPEADYRAFPSSTSSSRERGRWVRWAGGGMCGATCDLSPGSRKRKRKREGAPGGRRPAEQKQKQKWP